MVENEDSSFPEDAWIVTSLDGSYAISDAFKRILRTAKERLLMAAPWWGKGFVDLLRNLHLNGIAMNAVAQSPEKVDRTVYAVDSMHAIANAEGWDLTFKFNPNLHAKFIVVDNTSFILGSSNYTDSGIYYNYEMLYISKRPAEVKQQIGNFNKLWAKPENVSYQQIKIFHGLQTGDVNSYYKRIAERAIGLFNENGNTKTLKCKVSKELQTRVPCSENDAITVLRNLVKDGILYEPDDLSYRMAQG